MKRIFAHRLTSTPVLILNANGEDLDFRLERSEVVRTLGREQTLRRLIRTFRSSGFEVGYTELGICDFDEESLPGHTLVAPLETIYTRGAVPVVE